VRYLHQGAYLETAAAAAGWSRDTLHSTLKQGALERAGGVQPRAWALGQKPTDDPPIPDAATFSDAVEKAQANAELTDLMVIGAAAMPRHINAHCEGCGKPGNCEHCGRRIRIEIPGQWTASAWRLERKFPKRYGQRSRLDVNTVDEDEVAEILGGAAAAIEDAAQTMGLSEGQISDLLAAVRTRWQAMAEGEQA
jgi:hypothetical protein